MGKRKNSWKHGRNNNKKRKFNNAGFGQNHHKKRRQQNSNNHGPIEKYSSRNFNKHKKTVTFPSTNFREKNQQMSQQPPSKFRKIRESLPVFEARPEIVRTIRKNQSCVIIGPTGSGKSTQVCQYIIEEKLNNGKKVGIVQPRRVAAISLAKRVAQETSTVLGKLVGYHVRFDNKTNENTKIKFVTNGMLIREAMRKQGLSDYSIIILDEAHERSLQTDILFGILKDMQQKQKLKIISMSATLEATKFSEYFDKAPILQVEGRMFPVTIAYTETSTRDPIDASLAAVQQIHISQKNIPGDILVFMTGRDDIERCVETLIEMKEKDKRIENLAILPFYSALPYSEQNKVFKPVPKGQRKVIFATNIAETSLTITNIRFVVDGGLAKKRNFDPNSGIEVLKPVPISQSEAWQRSGRAGRQAEGVCLRLYTEENFEERSENVVPEILRVNLAHVILQLKSLGIKDVVGFDFMDKPSDNSIIHALKELRNLNALDENLELTKLGKNMSQFPVAPVHACALVNANLACCSKEILIIMAMMNVDGSIFDNKTNKISECDRVLKSFRSEFGDPLTLLNIWNLWQDGEKQPKWCEAHFLNPRAMINAEHIHNQLTEIYTRVCGEPKSCGEEIDLVRQCLCSSFINNFARLVPKSDFYHIKNRNVKARIHPSSSLFTLQGKKKPTCVIFFELVFTERLWLRDCLIIEEFWLQEMGMY